MLPTVSAFRIERALKIGLELNAQINKHAVFERKNPDLPCDYQSDVSNSPNPSSARVP